jgi:hypothetical protein
MISDVSISLLSLLDVHEKRRIEWEEEEMKANKFDMRKKVGEKDEENDL